jgi:hypothetical protein
VRVRVRREVNKSSLPLSRTTLPNSPTQHLPDVYPFVAYLGRRFGCKSIIALGETAAENLRDFHPEFEVIGVVKEANLRRYREQYPFGTWLDVDEISTRRNSVADNILEHSVIVCTDPVDQLQLPADLLKILRSWVDLAPACILTLAEKDLGLETKLVDEEPKTHPGKWSVGDAEYLLQAIMSVVKRTPSWRS